MAATKKAIIISLAVLLLIAVGAYGYASVKYNAQPVATAQPAPVAEVNPPTVDELLQLVNAERAKAGVAPLTIDSRLNTSAQRKADDMLKYDYYAHESPKSPNSNGDSRQWLFASGIQCSDSSENLDENSTSLTAVNAWNGSPAHYAAMVNVKNTLTGFGIAGKDKNGYYLFVEHFCQQ